MFEKLDVTVLVRKGPAYVIAGVYEFEDDLFFKRGATFIRLMTDKRTGDLRTSWVKFSNNKVPANGAIGYLINMWPQKGAYYAN